MGRRTGHSNRERSFRPSPIQPSHRTKTGRGGGVILAQTHTAFGATSPVVAGQSGLHEAIPTDCNPPFDGCSRRQARLGSADPDPHSDFRRFMNQRMKQRVEPGKNRVIRGREPLDEIRGRGVDRKRKDHGTVRSLGPNGEIHDEDLPAVAGWPRKQRDTAPKE